MARALPPEENMRTIGRLGALTVAIVAGLLLLGSTGVLAYDNLVQATGAQWAQGAAGTTWVDWVVLGVLAIAVVFVVRRHPWLALKLQSR
jgi:hypothetical protein